MIRSNVPERYLSIAYLVTVIMFNSKDGYCHHYVRVTLGTAAIVIGNFVTTVVS